MTQVPPAPAAPAAPAPRAPAPGVPAPAAQLAPTTQPPAHVDDPDPEDPEGDDDLTAQQRATRARRRLISSRNNYRDRAAAAEQQVQALQARITQLETQNTSVTQLRQSLLTSAIRGHAAAMVTPEALDDVTRLLDVTDLQVGDDGKVDEAKVKTKLEELVKAKPYLAARSNGTPSALPGAHQGVGTPAPTGARKNDPINNAIREAVLGARP